MPLTTPSPDLLLPLTNTSFIFGGKVNLAETKNTHLRFSATFQRGLAVQLQASREYPGMTKEVHVDKMERVAEAENGCDLFDDLQNRFLSFKKNKYLKNFEQFQSLSKAQSPKFMVIACADSRVCPSNILGFQPGEAFIIRNVANMVPPCEIGPSETNAALEFAVNSLQVENLLVIGHSCCGGIRALMSMQDEDDSSFIRKWVVVGKNARLITQAAASNLSFDQQCRHCEKESVNRSLLNLLTYPWIEEKVRKGLLAVHGGYYDFTNCTFEKWTLDYEGCSLKEENGLAVKDQLFWC